MAYQPTSANDGLMPVGMHSNPLLPWTISATGDNGDGTADGDVLYAQIRLYALNVCGENLSCRVRSNGGEDGDEYW